MGVEYSTLIVGKKITHQTDPDLLCNKHLQSEKSVILDVTPRPYYSKDSKIDPETLKSKLKSKLKVCKLKVLKN